MDYSKHVSTRSTSQRERTPGRIDEVENSAGGFVFAVNDWVRLERFLILGSEGGTYYIGENTLTRDNAEAVIRCINEDGPRVVEAVVNVSDTGRAHKNDPALFVLAMAAKLGNEEARKTALHVLPQVARIGTHLFTFLQYLEAFGGWGRATRRAVAKWYTEKNPEKLAYQLLKYQSRNGWSHRDVLRLAHPITEVGSPHQIMLDVALHPQTLPRWIAEGDSNLPRLYAGYHEANDPDFAGNKASLVAAYGLSHEMLPTEWLKDEAVNKVLLAKMPLMATIRQLGRLTANGTLKPLAPEVKIVAERLTNQEQITRSRIHPMHYLLALKTYEEGMGFRGSLSWSPIPQIVKALNEGFYKAFVNVEPTGKAFLLGVDVSGSMSQPIGGTHVSCAQAAGAMALVTAKTEANYFVHGFTCGSGRYGYRQSSPDGFIDLGITADDNLADALRKVQHDNFGGTDCALPMIYAEQKRLHVDCFVVLTDSETWAGNVKPYQALQSYRRHVNPAAKLVVVGMAGNKFSIADPRDAGMLDVVGFDANVPAVIADFVR